MVENLGKSGAAREQGRIVAKPIGEEGRIIDFGKVKHFAMTIPWGDISTAYHTTGIPNIKVFTGVPKSSHTFMKMQAFFNPILRNSFIKKQIQQYVDKKIVGPTAEQLENGRSYIWGKVSNAKGETKEARLECAEGYKLTAEMALIITEKVLAVAPKGGYHTPAELFGYDLILEMDGAKFIA
jgi:short subunit dehydrogenase-like uncharacterized protein